MNIMHKRPLSLILCTMLCGFVLFSYLNPGALKIFTAIATAIYLVLSLIFSALKRKVSLNTVCSIVLAISSVLSFVYFDCYYQADKRLCEECTVIATVEDEEVYEGYSSYTVKATSVSGERFPSYRLSFYLTKSNTEDYTPAIGDKIEIVGKIESASQNIGDFFRRFNSNGINGYIEDITSVRFLESGKPTLKAVLASTRDYLTRHAKMLTDSESGAFLSALIFGERDELSPAVRLDFTRIGISHVLALSGMHLAILAFGINALLSTFKINKKCRLGIIILLAVSYSIFTGLSVTVVRAAIMLVVSSSLFFLGREHDSLTSLSISVSLITLVTPYAIFNISLWLSALATLGVIAAAELLSELEYPRTKPKKILHYLLGLFVPSIFAISATLLMTSVAFGGVSTVSLFTTPLFSLLIEIIMYLGTLTLILGGIIPIGKLLVPISDFTLSLANKISENDLVYVSSESVIYLISVILLTLLFYAFLFIEFKRNKAISLLVFAVLSVCISVSILSNVLRSDSGNYYSAESNDVTVISSVGHCYAIINSSHSRYAHSVIFSALEDSGLTNVEAVVYTSYSYGLEEELNELLGDMRIKQILMPTPECQDEWDILTVLQDVAETHGRRIVLYNTGESIPLGNERFTLLCRSGYGKPKYTAQIIDGKEATLYLSAGFEEEFLPKELAGIYGIADRFVIGRYGVGYKEDTFINSYSSSAKEIIISCDNLYYTQDVLKKYKENGCSIILHPHKVELYKVK